jgi:hypothetical protein
MLNAHDGDMIFLRKFIRSGKSLSAIDLGQLEQDFSVQAKLMSGAVGFLIKAKKELRTVQSRREVVGAEVKRRIRKRPDRYGIKRFSEGALKEALTLDLDYQSIVDEENKAQDKVDSYQGIVNVLEHRKRSIEGEITLHGQGYFAKPKVSKEAQDRMNTASLMRKRKKTRD